MKTPKIKNQFRKYNNYVVILLYTVKKVYKAFIDVDDFIQIKEYRWAYVVGRCPAGYIVGGKKNVSLSRLLLNVTDSNILVDHKDRNPLNNRRTNLRIANKSTNAMNSKKRIDNTSGFKGVSWRADRKKWRVYITKNQKIYNLGHFKNLEEAIKIRKKAEKKLFGKFSPLNI